MNFSKKERFRSATKVRKRTYIVRHLSSSTLMPDLLYNTFRSATKVRKRTYIVRHLSSSTLMPDLLYNT
jgi:hypothetical protein